MQDSAASGLIFNIQRYSVHDGPGIRTTVFFKGCPLRCLWCCNPESQNVRPEIGYNPEKCFRCGRCAAACSKEAIQRKPDGSPRLDRELCADGCQDCVAVCPDKALTVYGRRMSVREVLEKAGADGLFQSRSGGGITVSGGEPFAQRDFLFSLLREARRVHMNTALETCAFTTEADFVEGCGLLDFLIVDVKHSDSAAHRSATGVPLEPVMRNIRAMRAAWPKLPVRVRTPVIPGINDRAEVLEPIARLAMDIGAEYELMPYHRMGLSKYASLGRACPLDNVFPDEKVFAELKSTFSKINVNL